MTARTSRAPAGRAHSRGFTLIEVLVASALGLVVALAVTAAVVSSVRQFSIISGNATSQNSAQIGLSLIDMAGRNAGSGFFSNNQTICQTWNAYNGTVKVSDGGNFMPVRIVNGATAADPDSLVFTGATGSGALAAAPVMTDAAGANLQVSNSGALAAGDYAVVGVPGSASPCTLIQITQAPTVVASCGGNAPWCQLLVRNPGTGLNPTGGAIFATRPTYAFASGGTAIGPAVVSRVGSVAAGFRQDAFAVQCGALVRYNAFTTAALPGCTSSPLGFGAGVEAIAADVVQMQAQYGISNSAASDVVSSWVNASGGTWAAPSVADIARIKAVRVVLVARSREADIQEVSAPCTNGALVVNTGPCSFEDAAAPVIDLSTVPVPAGKTWRNYRYRVHSAVIPLRSVIWSD